MSSMANVLLIEPDKLLGETCAQALANAGYHVRAAADAQTAIALADEHQPDVVVLELQLVAHSGLEFLYEFRSYAEWRDIPVILHSQVPQRQLTRDWPKLQRSLGVVEYLYKPTSNLRDLVAAVRAAAPAKLTRPAVAK
jgi:DNA-binding response OmpR family regulator